VSSLPIEALLPHLQSSALTLGDELGVIEFAYGAVVVCLPAGSEEPEDREQAGATGEPAKHHEESEGSKPLAGLAA